MIGKGGGRDEEKGRSKKGLRGVGGGGGGFAHANCTFSIHIPVLRTAIHTHPPPPQKFPEMDT